MKRDDTPTIVIGAGVIGVATAHALHEAGTPVLVIDRQPGPGLEASFANGALLHASLAEPWNAPGVHKMLLKSLASEEAAVLVRLRALPQLIGWGVRFLKESTRERFHANALKNLRLAQFSLQQMAAIRGGTTIRYDYYRRGILTLFREPSAFEAAIDWYEGLAAHGLEVEVVHAAQAVELEPALAPVQGALVGGIYAPGDEAGDPHAFCCEMRRQLEQAGVGFRFDTAVRRLIVSSGQIEAIELESGERIAAGAVVLAAGSQSTALAATVGLDLPVRPAKGYSLTLPRGESGTAPGRPVCDTSLHMAVIPVGADRIRVAGTAEFAGYDLAITESRVSNLRTLLHRLYPRYAAAAEGVEAIAWTGLRPMSADGVPLIGASPVAGLYLNTGHGHVGWTLAAGSGRLLADVMLGRRTAIDAADYSVARFN